jgi:ubiquinone/menaquinone biosynthesis C-methylase UbiE
VRSKSNAPEKLHSAEYFGPERDFWWNKDFLGLMAKRLRLKNVRSVLDVGCGVGHWGRTLLPHLHASAQVTGVDRERSWVKRATRTAEKLGLGHRIRNEYGLAESLPFADASFDLVTCQTLLIHVADPPRVIAEMLRVTRVGGRVLLVEPNNLASALVFGSTLSDISTAKRLQLVRLQSICERGKAALSEGNDSIGDLAPGMLSAAGAVDLNVYLSDRASPLVPPYHGVAQRAARDQILDWARREYWLWDQCDARRYFIAGGGTTASFERCWSTAISSLRQIARDLREGTYHTGGGGIMYLITGRRVGS